MAGASYQLRTLLKNLFSNILSECFPLNDPWYHWVSTLVFSCQKHIANFQPATAQHPWGSQHKLVKFPLYENLKHSFLDPRVGTQLGIEKCYLNCWQHFLKQMSPRSNQDYQDWYAGKFRHYKKSKISEIKMFSADGTKQKQHQLNVAHIHQLCPRFTQSNSGGK